jgi:hypothetical protein
MFMCLQPPRANLGPIMWGSPFQEPQTGDLSLAMTAMP